MKISSSNLDKNNIHPTITISSDKTIKLTYSQGYHSVLIPHTKGKVTLCLSSQIGCAVGCKYCQSAKGGFKKNLTTKQIIQQFEDALEYYKPNNLITNKNSKGEILASNIISSIVFMGMGEPLNNTDNVLSAIKYFNKVYGYPFKKITISTSGIISQVKKIIQFPGKIQLAISLHTPFQKIRDKLMPNLSTQPISKLLTLCKIYNEHYKQKIMIEYLMIENLTDRDKDLEKLLNLGFDKLTNFNLILLNGTLNLDNKTYNSSTIQRCNYFKEQLIKNGYKCFIRQSIGLDIDASCGLLSISKI